MTAETLTSFLAGKEFFEELLAHYGTLSQLSEQFGQSTLIDMWHLQNAIAENGFIDVFEDDSAVIECIAQLPQGLRWMCYVRKSD